MINPSPWYIVYSNREYIFSRVTGSHYSSSNKLSNWQTHRKCYVVSVIPEIGNKLDWRHVVGVRYKSLSVFIWPNLENFISQILITILYHIVLSIPWGNVQTTNITFTIFGSFKAGCHGNNILKIYVWTLNLGLSVVMENLIQY